MVTQEVLELLERALAIIEDETILKLHLGDDRWDDDQTNSLLDVISRFEVDKEFIFDSYSFFVKSTAGGKPNFLARLAPAYEAISRLQSEYPSTYSKEIFEYFQKYIAALQEFYNFTNYILSEDDNIVERYELSRKRLSLIYACEKALRDLKISFRSFRTAFRYMLEILPGFHPVTAGNQDFTLKLRGDFTAGTFANKIKLIDNIYEELSAIYAVPLEDYPLSISRIESSSLWAKLFGQSQVIDLLIALIKASASFLYRNYTVEGKVQNLSKQVAAVEAILDLSGKLREKGVDASSVEANALRASENISKALCTLLSQTRGLEISGVSFSPVENAVGTGVVSHAAERRELSDSNRERIFDMSAHREGPTGAS